MRLDPISRDGNAEASTSRSPPPPLSSPHPLTPSELYFVPSPSDSGSLTALSDRLSHITVHIPKRFHSMAAGAGAGFVSSVVTCPLDVIKTRLQAQHLSRNEAEYEGVRGTVRRIWRQRGFKGFYRGLGPTVAGYLPTWGIYFTVYDLVKDRLGSLVENTAHPGANVTLVHLLAAMSAGATGTVVTNPLWVVKTRFMSQAVLPPSEARYRNTFDAIFTIYRQEGFRAFYKGLLPSLIGVTHVAVQFPLYEKAKQWADHGSMGDHSALPPSTILACSAISKGIASLATYPHEVLRTRLQIARSNSAQSTSSETTPSVKPARAQAESASSLQKASEGRAIPRPRPNTLNDRHTLYSPLVTGSNPPPPRIDPAEFLKPAVESANKTRRRWKDGGIVETFLKIVRQDGWTGLYRGLSINLVRTVPNSAVTMLTYELIMRNLST